MGTLDGLEIRDQRDVFIETGYGQGDTIVAMLKYPFQDLFSIELDSGLSTSAMYVWKDHPRVHIHGGDSVTILPHIIDSTRSTTFWLDAHYAGGLYGETDYGTPQCPLLEELDIILNVHWRQPITIFIDDVRVFNPDWWDDESRYEPARGKLLRAEWPTQRQILDALMGLEVDMSREDIWAVRL